MEKKPTVTLVTGITGQDGTYLAEYLLERGFIVHGIVRKYSKNRDLLKDLQDNYPGMLTLHEGDIGDGMFLARLIGDVKPDQMINLAAQSVVHHSFEFPIHTADVTGVSVLRMLEAIRLFSPKTRFLQASTSEMFGNHGGDNFIKESTQMGPESPYGGAKLFGFHMVQLYRRAYGLFACNAISFNHESPRRHDEFISRKVTLAVARIVHGVQKEILLGNMNSKRDWSHAKDIVRGFHMTLEKLQAPDDIIFASGKQYSVRDFCKMAFARAGITIKFQGEGMNEIGVDEKTGRVLIRVDKRFFRPAEVHSLLGNAGNAYKKLGWKTEIDIHGLVNDMVDSDLALIKREMGYRNFVKAKL